MVYGIKYLFHRDINAQLKDCGLPSIKHTFDVWHFVKVNDYI